MSIVTHESSRPYPSVTRSHNASRQLSQVTVSILLFLLALLVSFPFLWMVRTSFMLPTEALRFPPIWIPQSISLENYTNALTIQPFARYILNSLFIAISVVFGQLLTASLG